MPNHYYIMAAESLSEVETVAQVITKSHPVGFGRALHRLRGVTLHQAKNSVRNIPLGIDVGDHIYATTDDTCSNIVPISDIGYLLGKRHFKHRLPRIRDDQYHLLVTMPLCRVCDPTHNEYIVGIPLGLLPIEGWRRAFATFKASVPDASKASSVEFASRAGDEQWLFDASGNRLI